MYRGAARLMGQSDTCASVRNDIAVTTSTKHSTHCLAPAPGSERLPYVALCPTFMQHVAYDITKCINIRHPISNWRPHMEASPGCTATITRTKNFRLLQLRELDVRNNSITGTLPSSWGSLTQASTLADVFDENCVERYVSP